MQHKEYSATGFSIYSVDNNTFIVTNKHVCEHLGVTKYTVLSHDKIAIDAVFVRVDDFADLCVLKIRGTIPALHLAQKNAELGDHVLTIGAPSGVFPILVEGTIAGYYNMNWRHADENYEVHFRSQVMSAPIYHGSSGSPVFDIDGNVIGIVFAVRSDVHEHISFLVPVSEILRFFDTSTYVQINN